jgi:hypothetical protein
MSIDLDAPRARPTTELQADSGPTVTERLAEQPQRGTSAAAEGRRRQPLLELAGLRGVNPARDIGLRGPTSATPHRLQGDWPAKTSSISEASLFFGYRNAGASNEGEDE